MQRGAPPTRLAHSFFFYDMVQDMFRCLFQPPLLARPGFQCRIDGFARKPSLPSVWGRGACIARPRQRSLIMYVKRFLTIIMLVPIPFPLDQVLQWPTNLQGTDRNKSRPVPLAITVHLAYLIAALIGSNIHCIMAARICSHLLDIGVSRVEDHVVILLISATRTWINRQE